MSRPVTVGISGPDGDGQLELSHTLHGDVQLTIESTDITKQYRMTHGGDVSMFAALLGYTTRMGYDDQAIGQMVGPPLDEARILSEYPRDPLRSRLTLPPPGVENGARMRVADVVDLRWFALGLPVIAEPGNRQDGTGFYSAQDMGRSAFVVARPLPEGATAEQRYETATFLGIDDVPPVVRALSRFALGEYRQNMAGVFWRRLPEYIP